MIDDQKREPRFRHVEVRERAFDGMFAAWWYEPRDGLASAWVCVAVENDPLVAGRKAIELAKEQKHDET